MLSENAGGIEEINEEILKFFHTFEVNDNYIVSQKNEVLQLFLKSKHPFEDENLKKSLGNYYDSLEIWVDKEKDENKHALKSIQNIILHAQLYFEAGQMELALDDLNGAYEYADRMYEETNDELFKDRREQVDHLLNLMEDYRKEV